MAMGTALERANKWPCRPAAAAVAAVAAKVGAVATSLDREALGVTK